VEWIHQLQNRDKWRPHVKTALISGYLSRRVFLEQLRDSEIFKDSTLLN
jgi:hypothetical protein